MNTSFLKHAGIGAAAMVAAGFVPFVSLFAPAIGGGVAGWLGADTEHSGAKLGGAAGAMASLLFVPLVLLGTVLAVFDFGITLLVFLAIALVGTAVLTGFGALGGMIGSAVAEDSASTDPADAESTPTGTPGRTRGPDRETVNEIRRRYASGELTESELERELDRVLSDDPPPSERRETASETEVLNRER